MAAKMNVMVYSGTGSTTESVRHCLFTLRRLLSPSYAVIPVTGDVLIKEPWMASCALLVFPGGADLGYCRTLNGEGNRRITHYVKNGGSYLGFCAGGYYGSAKCEFEPENPDLAVVGSRELEFFPGVCRGLAFPGFVYHSESGARAADLYIHKTAFSDVKDELSDSFKSYYNGGGVFVDAKTLESHGVEILASYTEDLHVDSGEGKAAIVYRKVGQGNVILTGPHPEFTPTNLAKPINNPDYSSIIDAITVTDSTRVAFMRLLLSKLGLNVNEEPQAVPFLSRLHLSSHKPAGVTDLTASWSEIFTIVDGEDYIVDANDIFHVKQNEATFSVQGLTRAVSDIAVEVLPKALVGQDAKKASLVEEQSRQNKQNPDEDNNPKSREEQIRERVAYTESASPDRDIDYDKIVKRIVPHENELPTKRDTPFFNHESYYANLAHHHQKAQNHGPTFGTSLLYAEVTTSTSTILEKNPSLLRNLPDGFTVTATTQVAGRGRGSNVWIAPPGALMFSTVIRHSFSLTQSAPVIFVQYVAALAVAQGIKNYAPGYENVTVKLKWPNDIYAQIPGSPTNPLVKIVGILVNSSYSGSDYSLTVGIGLNLDNPLPTISFNSLLSAIGLKAMTNEKLLASILASFESLYRNFCQSGWNRELEELYYENWLHSGQVVTLEAHGGMKARVKGITRDWGLLLAEELSGGENPTGRIVSLQSDSNRFDFFKGLISRKV
ncbi:biotin holocarboxylase synthetase [Didymosphaeria variabile]|uniref:Biotin holocarboxylase synthetase n=1 Tax=Didymosphaeria variabile TaxID=1932322 RepID=A0A9W8XIA5_9PLEO|nr:biotin holocarboxylase synthetase [Didymosphaeria variabile]KAJ4349906.1 biotin holocarboxylase synthetase [Didymosphaeria variabile]